jgi:cell division transport system ATP-binding protein
MEFVLPLRQMIQMDHVSKTYPNQISALADIRLEISAGEFSFILGSSGSGKTTLLCILSGSERVSSGEVIVNGFHITQAGFKKIHQLRRTMGIIPQDLKLLWDRTVHENVAFPLEVTGHLRREVQRRVSEILRQVGLEEREADPILALSAGEKQRVAIARALVHDPPLLLADEPTANLDAEMEIDVMRILTELHQKGTTILCATHDDGLPQRYPYRVVRISNGRIG